MDWLHGLLTSTCADHNFCHPNSRMQFSTPYYNYSSNAPSSHPPHSGPQFTGNISAHAVFTKITMVQSSNFLLITSTDNVLHHNILLELYGVAYLQWNLKARSHGAIFLFATAMQKMDCVDVNEGVHMVRFHVYVMHWCVRHRTGLGSTPILCNCDVRFQCKYIGNCIQTHRTLWTKSLNRKQHSISWYNKSQSHIVPCERASKHWDHHVGGFLPSVS